MSGNKTEGNLGDSPLSTPVYKKRVVIAIDFGSTHCGIAYSLVNFMDVPDPSNPNFDYLSILDKPEVLAKIFRGKYDKVPTCAIFDAKTEKVTKFGFEANETYLEMVANEDFQELEESLYFEGRDIKMRLWEKVLPFDKIEVRSQDGKGHLPLYSVVGGILEYLKLEALKLASKGLNPADLDGDASGNNTSTGILASEALWVLTVPSIWQEADKQFMRKAAHLAGMISSAESTDLVLALEPECAVIAAGESLKGFKQGDKILTLDCGGGTVDIAAVEVMQPWPKPGKKAKTSKKKKNKKQPEQALRLRHLIEPCGGNWGSTYIDRKFQEFMEIFLKDARLDRLRRTDPASVIELMNDFEALKTSITAAEYKSQKGSRSINLANVIHAINEDHNMNRNWDMFYGQSVRNFAPEEARKAVEAKDALNLQDILDEYNARVKISKTNYSEEDGFNFSYIDGLSIRGYGSTGTDLVLPMPLIASFFEKVISKIATEVEDLMQNPELKGLKYLLIVGGFAECGVLIEELRKAVKQIDKNVKVLIPKHPATVVQKGAVHYGFDPNIISTRRARQTVGVKVTMRLKDLKKHNPDFVKTVKNLDKHTTVNSKNETLVKDVFNVFITKGQEISTSEIIRKTFRPPGKEAKVKFDIYATDSTDPKFITDSGCVKLASLAITVGKGGKSAPLFEYQMCFASTEITAHVKNTATGETKELMLLYNNLLDNANSNTMISGGDSLIAVKIREIKAWGDTAFDLGELEEREMIKREGVSEML